jgi:hypothetical protein
MTSNFLVLCERGVCTWGKRAYLVENSGQLMLFDNIAKVESPVIGYQEEDATNQKFFTVLWPLHTSVSDGPISTGA